MNNFQKLLLSLTSYLYISLKIKELPKLYFKYDNEDPQILGKTALYNFKDNSIILFTKSRHPKDILRSFAHEMVHHKQNEQKRLDKVYTTDIKEDNNLKRFEEEAYLIGNMLFRNWETMVKNNKLTVD